MKIRTMLLCAILSATMIQMYGQADTIGPYLIYTGKGEKKQDKLRVSSENGVIEFGVQSLPEGGGVIRMKTLGAMLKAGRFSAIGVNLGYTGTPGEWIYEYAPHVTPNQDGSLELSEPAIDGVGILLTESATRVRITGGSDLSQVEIVLDTVISDTTGIGGRSLMTSAESCERLRVSLWIDVSGSSVEWPAAGTNYRLEGIMSRLEAMSKGIKIVEADIYTYGSGVTYAGRYTGWAKAKQAVLEALRDQSDGQAYTDWGALATELTKWKSNPENGWCIIAADGYGNAWNGKKEAAYEVYSRFVDGIKSIDKNRLWMTDLREEDTKYRIGNRQLEGLGLLECDKGKKIAMSVYPVVNNGHFHLSVLNTNYGSGRVQIYDQLGRQVSQVGVEKDRSIEREMTLDLASGMYHIVLKDDTGKVIDTKKIEIVR